MVFSVKPVFSFSVCRSRPALSCLHPQCTGVPSSFLSFPHTIYHTHMCTPPPQVGHHVFLNLETLEFYCLPDNYQIIDSSLEDIKVCSAAVINSYSIPPHPQYVLRPTFSEEHVATLDSSSKLSIALDGTKYLPGLVPIPTVYLLSSNSSTFLL